MSDLSASRASRLARSATRQRRDGSRDWVARRAWRRLAGAADRGSQHAVSAVWQMWLRDPGDELWQALARWREPDALAEDACEAAVDPGRPAGERAAIGEFCARHSLAPGDGIQRAVFYLLTGQTAQHAADDPDGSRTATGYQGAGEPARAMLRHAIAGSGSLDLVRLLGARAESRPGPRLTVNETADLGSHLASRRDWPALWRLAQGLPLAEAVRAARRLGGGWQPRDDRERPLFSLLSQADADAIASARDALLGPVAVHIDLDDQPHAASFSPDGRQLLIATIRDGRHRGYRVYRLPDATLSEQHDDGHCEPVQVLHLGEALYVVRISPSRCYELVRHGAAGPVVIDSTAPVEGMWIFRHPAGLISEKRVYPWDWLADAGRRRALLLHVSGSTIRRVVTVPGYGAGIEAVDPRTGRALLRWRRRMWLTDGDCTRVVARLPRVAGEFEGPEGVVFPGPDRLTVFYRGGRADLFRTTGARVVREARVSLPEDLQPRSFVMLRGEIAVGDHSRGLAYLTETLTPVTQPRLLAGASGDWLRGSDDGQCLALFGLRDGHGFADVICANDPAVSSQASQPMAEMSPANLAAVTTALAGPVPGAAARPFLELLRQCLKQRFGTDVALSEATPAPGCADDAGIETARPWPR